MITTTLAELERSRLSAAEGEPETWAKGIDDNGAEVRLPVCSFVRNHNSTATVELWDREGEITVELVSEEEFNEIGK